MAVDVIVSSNNVTVTTAQKTLVGSPGTFENSDASFSVSVPSGGTTVGADITLTKNDNTTVSAISNIDLDLGVIDPAADGAVENTDVSYSDTVASGGTLVIPDINITKNDDSVVTSPAAINLDLRIIDPSAPLPATWDELVAEYGQGYPYGIPSNQGTSYRTGDAKDIEDTVYAAARVASKLKMFNTLASFFTLNNNNAEGNTTRFLDVNGLQVFGNNAVIDHYTGIMWLYLSQAGTTWNGAIDAGLASTSAGFSDWHNASIEEYLTIVANESKDKFIADISQGVLTLVNSNLWTSSTQPNDANDGIYANASTSRITLALVKTYSPLNSMYCRKHF